MPRSDNLVYSSEHGRMCPTCGQTQASCACNERPTTAPATRGPVRVGRETKGRKGKGVTMITGITLTSDALAALTKELKQKCGAGGTVRDGVIEIQGDHRDLLVEELQRLGWKAKRSGG